MNRFIVFLQEKDGVSAIEYALLAGLIALAIVISAGLIGTNLNTVYGYVRDGLATVVNPAA